MPGVVVPMLCLQWESSPLSPAVTAVMGCQEASVGIWED